jgi:hypothetical protein
MSGRRTQGTFTHQCLCSILNLLHNSIEHPQGHKHYHGPGRQLQGSTDSLQAGMQGNVEHCCSQSIISMELLLTSTFFHCVL